MKSVPSIIVVEPACLSNNGRINWSENLEIPIVGEFIEEIIGPDGVRSYKEKAKYSVISQ